MTKKPLVDKKLLHYHVLFLKDNYSPEVTLSLNFESQIFSILFP